MTWVPWRRPGFQLGLDIAAIKESFPEAIGCILGGHGITAWGETSQRVEENSLWIIDTAAAYIGAHSKAQPFGAALSGFGALPPAERRTNAAALAPTIRALVSTDRAQVGHFTDAPEVLDFLSRVEHPRLVALGTSCPDHFLRTKVKPLLLDLPAGASVQDSIARLAGTARRVSRRLPVLLRPERDPRLARHPRRRPAHRPGPRCGHVQLRRQQADRARRR